MQLNQATDYAFRAMLHLAGLPAGSTVNTVTLAEAEAIPQRFLLKIMRLLTQAGLIKSLRGVDGGFKLERAPEEISLLDIIIAMEGPIAIHKCLGEREACNKHCSNECPVHGTLHHLQDQLESGLRGATLAKLVEQKRQGVKSKTGEIH